MSKKKAKYLRIKLPLLAPLSLFLNDLELPAAHSRARTWFLREIAQSVQDYEHSRMDIISRYGEKDEAGKLIIVDNKFRITADQQKQFDKEMNELVSEELVIKVDATNEVNIQRVKYALETVEKKLSGTEAVQYDEYCTAFESI